MATVHPIKRFPVFLAIAVVMLLGISQVKAAGNADVLAQEIPVHELQVETAGILNNDERGAVSNVVLDFYAGPNALITSLAWNVNVTSYPGSYLSEMQVTFSDTAGNGVTFTPGDGDDFDGTMDYAGFQDLNDVGLAFHVGTDGILRLEFHDGFKDLAFDEPEGIWNSGTLTFGISQVPEPAAVTMMLGGLLVLSRAIRRRRD